ncbi:MAG: CoA transferase [Desulfarculaceae bacterium]
MEPGSKSVSGGPLQGLRVLDLTSYVSGPFCAMILGDLGAEVIKIERPPKGDEMRGWPPLINGLGSYFAMANRNKKSMTLNLGTPQGRDIFSRLLPTADVLVENFRPGVMERLGLGSEQVLQANPRLVFCRISGFGQTGPSAQRPGFDQILQGMSGLMSVTGTEESGPVRSGVAIGDVLTAIFGANGILAALLAREKTSQGQVVTTSLLESLVGVLSVQAGAYLATGNDPGPAGNDHPVVAPYGLFKVKDGHLNIAAATDAMFEKLCGIIGMPHLAQQAEFSDNGKRMQHKQALVRELEKGLASGTRQEWEEKLTEAQIPCGPILSIGEAFAQPQVQHLEMLAQVDHPTLGRFQFPGIPVKLADTPASVRSAPPALGEHTEVILQELGYTPQEVDDLRAKNIL